MAGKRRKIIFAILIALLIAVGGFAASLFLIPSEETVQELQALDVQAPTVTAPDDEVGLEQHKQHYEEQLSAGTLTIDVVNVYAQSLIAAGQNEEAAKVWQEYVNANPADVAGWKGFAQINQAAGYDDNFLQGLQKIAELEPTEEHLVALSSYQNYKQDYVGQVETLKKIVVVTNEGEPKYLIDMADIAMLVDDKEAALAALNSYYTKHATRLTEAAANYVVPETLLANESGAASGDVPSIEGGEENVGVVDGVQEGVDAVQSRLAQRPKGADYTRLPSYVRLLAQAERDEDALAQALEHTKEGRGVEQRPEVAEALLYEVGAESAIEYIETLSAQAEVPESLKAPYARALVQQGKYEIALPILKALSAQGGDYREWYFLALSAAAKSDNGARVDLVEHVKESFSAGDLTEAQKIDRVYSLINAGEKARALDYTERSMHSVEDAEYKAQWQDIYKGLTFKPKPAAIRRARVVPTVSLDQKFEMARQPGAKEAYIRSAAFELLAAKRKNDAVELFSVLSAMNGPASSDTSQLIYLWGARIAGPELGWVVDRANSAAPQDQAGWVSIVANHAASEDVAAIAQGYPAWLRYPEFERRYVDALMASGDTNAIQQYVATQASAPQTVEVYHNIASKAQSVMDVRTAEQALQKAAQADPSNRETWLRLTEMYMGRARYTAAEQTSQNALLARGDYVTSEYQAAQQELAANYYAAALAKRDGDNEGAQRHFSRVVEVGRQTMFEDRGSQVRFLSAQMALGDEQAASQGFENLLAQHPGEATLLADYISALLDRGSYLQALDVASRHGNDVSVDSVEALDDPSPLLVRSPDGAAPLMQSMSGGRELKLIFNRPIPEDFQLFANQQNPAWVSYTTASYDSALVVAQSGYSLQAAQTPDGLVVSAIPVGDTTSADAVRQRYLRLQLLYARLELETDEIDKALDRLESLSPIYQEYPEYRAYQGNAEYYAGNESRGLNLVKRAQKGDPQNEDIRYLRRNMERFHGEHLKADYEYRKFGDDAEMQIATIEARKQFADGWEVFAKAQRGYYDREFGFDAFGSGRGIEPDGFGGVLFYDYALDTNASEFRTDNGARNQFELSLSRFMDDSSIASASLYATNDTLGGGLGYQFVNTLGTTKAYLEYHKPYWDILDSVVANGTRDRAAAWHLWRPDPKWTLRLDAGYNRYNVEDSKKTYVNRFSTDFQPLRNFVTTDDKNGLANSIGVQGLVLRTLYDKKPYVALAYGLDMEYFLGNIDRNSRTGDKILPLRSREIHSLSGIFYYDFDQDTNAEVSAGYAVDRLGESGPAVEGRLTRYIAEEVDVQVRARYGLEAGNTDNDALSVGGYVRWTW